MTETKPTRNWESPPTEHVGNTHWSVPVLAPLDSLRAWTETWEQARYSPRLDGVRSWDLLGHTEIMGKRVLDYGCGLGLEAVLFAAAGNLVSIADIHVGNLVAASRLMVAHGFAPGRQIVIEGPNQAFPWHDVFFASGVLHHMPLASARQVLDSAERSGADDIRLLLYTDDAWRWATNSEPDRRIIVDHPKWDLFVRTMDAVGGYAEWYDERRVEEIMPGDFELIGFDRITENKRMAIVRMKRR